MTKSRGFVAVAGAALVAALLVAGMALGGVLGSDNAAAQSEEDQRRLVNVSGDGEVNVQPDTGMVVLGVEVTGETAEEALNEANSRIDAITAAIQALGIAEDDITTGNFAIWPEYDYSEEKDTPNIIGYRVHHTVNVKVRNINQTGDVVAAGVNNGANTVQSVSFFLENREEAVNQARELAFENARKKAEALAGLAGSELGPVVTISENTFEPGPVERGMPIEAEDAAGVPFNPGDATVRVHLEVSWELQ